MPKGSYVLFFLLTTAIFAAMQYFVFVELRRYIRTSFPLKAADLMRRFKWVFLVMNIPIILMYFRRQLVADRGAATGEERDEQHRSESGPSQDGSSLGVEPEPQQERSEVLATREERHR